MAAKNDQWTYEEIKMAWTFQFGDKEAQGQDVRV